MVMSEKSKEKRKSLFLGYVFTLIIFLSVFNIALIINKIELHNNAALYCEGANLNAKMFNEIEPYFQMYLEESIDSVSQINKTLGEVLELRLMGSKDLTLDLYDCPDPNCKLSAISPLTKSKCDTIYEIRSS